MQLKPDKSKTIGIVVLIWIAVISLSSFIFLFKDLVHDNVSSLIYLFITSITAIALFWMLSSGKVSGKNVLLSIPLTMAILLVLLVFFCRWEGSTEGLVLVSPAWLGGFTQGGPALSLKSEMPSKFNELVSKVFSYEALFGESIYVSTLFYWPGLVIWILTVLGLHLLSIRSQRSHQKELEREYSMMLSCIQRMFGVKIDEQYLSAHLRQATQFEVAKIIEDNKAKEIERKHAGYYIPPIDMFIKYSIERRPDLVFHLDRLDVFNDVDAIEMTPLEGRILTKELSTKDFYVFKYDSFGAPGTHLCARVGYVLYDPDLHDIVAEAFYGKS